MDIDIGHRRGHEVAANSSRVFAAEDDVSRQVAHVGITFDIEWIVGNTVMAMVW